jgi:Skp family chaperone for outer membrane proteins
MSQENRKSKKPIWLKFGVLALVLVTGGLTLAGCQKPESGTQSTEQLKQEQPTKSDSEESDDKLKQEQPTKSDSEESDDKLKQEQPTKSDSEESDDKLKQEQPTKKTDSKKSSQKKPQQKQGDGQDSQMDDDPE